MNTVFSNKPQEVLTGIDNVIIPQFISAIPGGRTLDMSGYTESTISAGWVIITDGNGNYKPMPYTPATPATPAVGTEGEAGYVPAAEAVPAKYAALPEGWQYAGVLVSTLLAAKPAATILTAGQVNEVAAPNDLATIKTAVAAVLPGIQFIKEENA